MPALLAGDLQVRQAHVDEGLARELALPALDLLHAENIRGLFRDEAGGLLGAQAYGVDVPGADPKAHAAPYGSPDHLETAASGFAQKNARALEKPGRFSGRLCRGREGIDTDADPADANVAPEA